MKIVFVSNFLNHHQIPLCEELKKHSESFFFVATENNGSQGFQQSTARDYVLDYAAEREKCEAEIMAADVTVFGSCPDELIKMRMAENKLSFLYAERFFKRGAWRRFIPRTRKHIKEKAANYKDKNFYVLCASAYLPYDLNFFGFPREKMLKWGYFPAVKRYDDINGLLREKENASILWVARLIEWKHPDASILVAEKLKKAGYNFKLRIIGSGVMEESLKNLIKEKNLCDCVEMLGAMSPEKVRGYMEKSQIFLFTSDRKEGWGAVVNEAMNGGCAVIASSAAGSPRFLIDDGKNGFLYKSGNDKELFCKLKTLLDDKGATEETGRNACETMDTLWNAQTAAERLLHISERILKGDDFKRYEEGPCSLAEVVKG